MSLTDSAIRNAKPGKQPIKLYDSGGLFVIIAPSGSKLWRLKYRFNGIEKAITFGRYPEVTLKDARQKRDEARKLLDADLDPGVERKRKKLESAISSANTFKIVCDEFLDLQERDGRSETTMKKNRWLAKQLLGELGRRPISEIEPFEILTILKRVESRGNHETAKRLATASIKGMAMVISAVLPGVRTKAIGRQLSSAKAWILLVLPPRDRPIASAWSPFLSRPPNDAL